jgi:SAM-dependent methyltransferase
MSELDTGYEVIHGCRSCASDDLDVVLDLGLMPLSDGLQEPGFDRESEERYPLTLVRCHSCSLLQILETVDPSILFGEDYPYFSSFSDALVEHSRSNVEAIIERGELDENSLVVEIASNDGYLLQWFAKNGIPVLGIDPAPGPANAAVERGIPTICEFFVPELAERLVGEGRRADVIIGNNVLAHVPDQNAFVAAMATLLSPDGTIVMEFPYVRDLIEHGEFDTIYHEHGCYFSVTSVRELFRRHGLNLVRVEHLSIHGGSLRVFFERGGVVETMVGEYLESEERAGMLDREYYERFAAQVADIRTELRAMLDRLILDGNRIAGYAAAAKGAILLNYCGIGHEQIEYIVDLNNHKQGLEMPGVAIPITGVEKLVDDPPDYLLVLAWNFKDEIMRQQSAFADHGGRFIVPIPKPVIV